MQRILCLTTVVLATACNVAWADPCQYPPDYLGYRSYPYPTGLPYYNWQTPPGNYGQPNSALYPCPRSNIPYEVGGTYHTNPAFYPHEMLYAHEYRMVIPRYEHRVYNVGCIGFVRDECTGKVGLGGKTLWSKHEVCVKPQTEVTVKYHRHYNPFSLFAPPWSASNMRSVMSLGLLR